MKTLRKRISAAVVLTLVALPLAGRSPQQQATASAAYTSAAAKIAQIVMGPADSKGQTVSLTADECSAFVSEGGVKLPTGVTAVHFSSTPGEITAVTKVDFDKITAGRGSMNPLMLLFNGVHEVTTKAAAEGKNGQATINIESVQIDGVTVPRQALEYFAEKYIQPKYGKNVGMNSTFAMPANIESAVVGQNLLTVTQK